MTGDRRSRAISRTTWPRRLAAVLVASAALAAGLAEPIAAGGRPATTAEAEARPADEGPRATLRSATEFLSPTLRAEQADDLQNRGMLWVEQGATLWATAPGADTASCRTCHGEASQSMRGVAARHPAIDAGTGRIVNLEDRINICRTTRQGQPPLPYDSDALLALTAHVALPSRGLPRTPPADPALAPHVAAGRALWHERQGQLNLACAHCHDGAVGRRLRGDTISSAVPNGYPAYRLEWNGLGSLHRRLRACQIGVRAIPFEAGAPEYLALEAYLTWRAGGLPLEAPAIRR